MITVGCWYTPNYDHWVALLKLDADVREIPFLSIETEPSFDGWERITCLKPQMALQLLDQCETEYLVLLDVDCRIIADRPSLALECSTKADVAFYARTKFNKLGKPAMFPRTGTMVFRNNEYARHLLHVWSDVVQEAPPFRNDQDCLLVALGRAQGVSVQMLPNFLCAVPSDRVEAPMILHDSASKYRPKARKLKRQIAALRWRLTGGAQ